MWTDQQKKIFGQSYTLTCKMFDKEITFEMARFAMQNLEDLDFEKTIQALNSFSRDSKNKFWPKVAEIRSIVEPELSLDAHANAIASKIRLAIARHGWCNKNAAMNEIGAIGWEIVERSGGWQYICENHGLNLNPGTFHAQVRDVAKSLIQNNSIQSQGYIALKESNQDVIKTLDFKIKELPK